MKGFHVRHQRVGALTRLTGLAAVALIIVMASVVVGHAQTACSPGPANWVLRAGQSIDVGSVTVENDATNLYVTYALTFPGASFGTLHLWVGNDLLRVPANPQGTPVPGHFPYQIDTGGATSYTFTVPLSEVGIADVAAVCPATLTLYVVTHAEVTMDSNGDGKLDHETAFGGDRDGNLEKGRWWYYGAYCLMCESNPVITFACNTAFAKGGYVFVTESKSNPEKLPSLKLTRNRWGWAINVKNTGQTSYQIWAGAGLNKTSNGTLVGTLTINWDGNYATVTYTLTSPNVMEELHIYTGDGPPTTIAPGQYGHTAYFTPKAGVYSQTFAVSDANGGGIWIVAHAVACYPVQ